jgi:hypothetical protein
MARKIETRLRQRHVSTVLATHFINTTRSKLCEARKGRRSLVSLKHTYYLLPFVRKSIVSFFVKTNAAN